MTEIETLKIEAANLFFAREQLQANLVQVNQKLQQIANTIQQLEEATKNGDSEKN